VSSVRAIGAHYRSPTTAANRLLGAIGWLATQKPGIYDGLDVPLHPPLPPEVEAQRWAND